MNELQKLDHNGTKVLTSKQLAECYETDTKIISNNFNRNKDKYILGKDYFLVNYADNSYHHFEDNENTRRPIYLWTECGTLLHAKSLNTNKAWEVYNLLIETYFRAKEFQLKIPKTPIEIAQFAADTANKLLETTKENEKLKDKIKKDKPKVEFYDKFVESKDTISVGEFAKMCCKQGFKIGKNKMFNLLRKKKILIAKGAERNIPYQRYIDLGWFTITPLSYKVPVGKDRFIEHFYNQTRINPKGQIALWNILKQNIYKEQVDLLL